MSFKRIIQDAIVIDSPGFFTSMGPGEIELDGCYVSGTPAVFGPDQRVTVRNGRFRDGVTVLGSPGGASGRFWSKGIAISSGVDAAMIFRGDGLCIKVGTGAALVRGDAIVGQLDAGRTRRAASNRRSRGAKRRRSRS